MRLKKSRAAAEEQLVALVTAGYEALAKIRADFRERQAKQTFNEDRDLAEYEKQWTGGPAKSSLH